LKLDENLTDSIEYTKLLFADIGRLLILVILDVIPIVNFVVWGYLGNVIKEPRDSNQLPPLENYFELWIQGLKIFVAAIVFMLIPILLAIPFISVIVLASWISVPFVATVGWAVAILLLLVGMLLAFFLAIVLAMAIVNMIKKGSFGSAFAIGEIFNIIGKIGWGTYILWLVVIFVCALIVSGIGSIPVIGWILSLLIAPIFGVFIARSASLVYLEGTQTQETAPPTEQT
jgi:hypothetical protein